MKSLPRRELSKSCCNLSPPKNTLAVPEMSERPRTAEAAPTLRSYISSHHLEKIPRFQQKGNLQAIKSKSETNLQIAVDFVQSPLQISKSSMSLAFSNFDKLFESSGEESTRTTILKEKASDNMEEEEVTVFPEDLLAMVFQERQGKQETKKVKVLKSFSNLCYYRFSMSYNAAMTNYCTSTLLPRMPWTRYSMSSFPNSMSIS